MSTSVHQTLEAASGPASKIGGVVTAVWGLTADEWMITGVIVGIAFTAFTFALNWYYKHKTLLAARMLSIYSDDD